jgi:predicted transcriptional regulator
MSVRLTWYGDKIKERLDEAQRLGIDETMLACVAPAQARVRVKSGILQGSLAADKGMEVAHKEGGRWVGRWGSFNVNYALWQEIKTFSHVGHQPYLRPAAEIQYPTLAKRIEKFWKRGGL